MIGQQISVQCPAVKAVPLNSAATAAREQGSHNTTGSMVLGSNDSFYAVIAKPAKCQIVAILLEQIFTFAERFFQFFADPARFCIVSNLVLTSKLLFGWFDQYRTQECLPRISL